MTAKFMLPSEVQRGEGPVDSASHLAPSDLCHVNQKGQQNQCSVPRN